MVNEINETQGDTLHDVFEHPTRRMFDSTGAYRMLVCRDPGCGYVALGRQVEWAGL